MKMKRKPIHLVRSALVLALALLLSGCSADSAVDRDLVYEDLQESFADSGLFSANIGIFSKTVKADTVSYGECGSGVIFKRDGSTYYALTASHVVSNENAQRLVFTVNTDMKTQALPGVDGMEFLSQDVYESMYPAETVYVSQRDDLAVIRFFAEEELSVIEIAPSDPKWGDHILCVGNPQNEWFAVSYGSVTSGVELWEAEGYSSHAMRHNAYMQVGSSGGAAIGEQMQLVGITPGAVLSPDGKTVKYGVLIPAGEINLCLAEWGGS
ncbi:MAG: trypsin-like peptidase domain-containing protein [Oscillospiraceae bacterium]|nr:trypsin-like peptidase domain-containing protein [Oscillospiraceae bacterium]